MSEADNGEMIPIEFVMNSMTKEGKPLFPNDAPFELVHKYLEECKNLLIGSSDNKIYGYPVVKEGSIKPSFPVSAVLLASFLADMNFVEKGDYASVDPKRMEVIQLWSKRAARDENLSYGVPVGGGREIRISKQTPIEIADDYNWVEEEDFIDGQVRAAGGKDPNIHLIPDGETRQITIDATEDQLRGFGGIYEPARLHVKFKVHRKTGKREGYKLLEFLPDTSKMEINMEEWELLVREGTEAWKDVSDPVAWVQKLRNGDEA